VKSIQYEQKSHLFASLNRHLWLHPKDQDFAYEEFYKDEKTQYAVIRALEIIGEAAKQIPNEIKDQYSNIPWQDIVRMRDKLIHHYYGIDLEVIWNTLNEDLNSLEKAV